MNTNAVDGSLINRAPHARAATPPVAPHKTSDVESAGMIAPPKAALDLKSAPLPEPVTPAITSPPRALSPEDIAAIGDEVRAEADAQAQIHTSLASMIDTIVDRVMAKLDQDVDGGLSSNEVDAGSSLFKSADENRDSVIDANELRSIVAERLGRSTNAEQSNDAQALADELIADLLKGDESMFVPAPDTGSVVEIIDESLPDRDARRSDRSTDFDTQRRVDHLAKYIGAKIRNRGFIEAPPVNISEIVGSLDLDTRAHRMMMKALSARYPNGLGISLRA